MSRIVIVAYRPKPGKEAELIKVVQEHVPILKTQGLVTDRKPVIMQAADKTIIEVFEWKSREAIDAAHTNSVVQELWKKFSQVCEYVPASSVSEMEDLFSEFTPIA